MRPKLRISGAFSKRRAHRRPDGSTLFCRIGRLRALLSGSLERHFVCPAERFHASHRWLLFRSWAWKEHTLTLLIIIIVLLLLFGGGGYYGYRGGYYGRGGHGLLWIVLVVIVLIILFGRGGHPVI